MSTRPTSWPLRPPRLTGHPGTRRSLPSETTRRASLARGVPASIRAMLTEPGVPLGPPVREPLERRFGVDLREVRLHADRLGEAATRELDAVGLTVGEHIAVRPGWGEPTSERGSSLLSHELAHVVAPPTGALIGRQTQGGAAL